MGISIVRMIEYYFPVRVYTLNDLSLGGFRLHMMTQCCDRANRLGRQLQFQKHSNVPLGTLECSLGTLHVCSLFP